MRLLLILLLLIAPGMGEARPIIADVSEDTIRLDESFTGKNILLFGARNDPGDVVVVMRGPQQNYVMRKKKRVLGLWVNQEQVRFYGVPEFYKVISDRPLSAIAPDMVRGALGVGFEHIGLTPGKPGADDFSQALRDYQQRRSLFLSTEKSGLSFMGESLFKTLVSFPDSIPGGTYTAEVYLFSDGQLSAMQSIPISVLRSGFDAVIADLARLHSVWYGIIAVLLALGAGWAGNSLFRKV